MFHIRSGHHLQSDLLELKRTTLNETPAIGGSAPLSEMCFDVTLTLTLNYAFWFTKQSKSFMRHLVYLETSQCAVVSGLLQYPLFVHRLVDATH